MRATTAGQANKTFYHLWWASLPLAAASIIALLLITLRWVLAGGLRHFQADLFLPWLSVSASIVLWLLLPASYYLSSAPADDQRRLRLAAAWQRASQEFADWLALPLALAYIVVPWGGLLILVGLSVWLLLASGDPGFHTLRQGVPIAIRLAIFILLYLIMTTMAAVVVGLWVLLRHRGSLPAAADETPTAPFPATGEEA